MTMEHLKDTEKFKTKFKKGDDLPAYLNKFVSWAERMVFNRISKRVNFLLTRMETLEDGVTVGQMAVWDGEKWTPIAIADLIWDITNGRMGINDPTPNEKLVVGGTVKKTRDLTAGVTT